jgi:hypothetical protein
LLFAVIVNARFHQKQSINEPGLISILIIVNAFSSASFLRVAAGFSIERLTPEYGDNLIYL